MCNFHYLGYYCSPNLSIHQNSTQEPTWNFLVTLRSVWGPQLIPTRCAHGYIQYILLGRCSMFFRPTFVIKTKNIHIYLMITTFSIFNFLFWLIWGYDVDKLSIYFVPKLSLICNCEKKCGHFLAIPSNSFLSKISDPENN